MKTYEVVGDVVVVDDEAIEDSLVLVARTLPATDVIDWIREASRDDLNPDIALKKQIKFQTITTCLNLSKVH